uniref:Uncharacterized protein n=1 Tax=Arundo donax TaxID=35708 RepID=A0A0A9E3V1_ARUDO
MPCVSVFLQDTLTLCGSEKSMLTTIKYPSSSSYIVLAAVTGPLACFATPVNSCIHDGSPVWTSTSCSLSEQELFAITQSSSAPWLKKSLRRLAHFGERSIPSSDDGGVDRLRAEPFNPFL